MCAQTNVLEASQMKKADHANCSFQTYGRSLIENRNGVTKSCVKISDFTSIPLKAPKVKFVQKSFNLPLGFLTNQQSSYIIRANACSGGLGTEIEMPVTLKKTIEMTDNISKMNAQLLV
jgi:hypothetical protein